MAIERQEWWMLSVPLELAVMARMGLHYPTAEELRANDYQDPRPDPDPVIVADELRRLQAGIYDDPLAVAIHEAVLEDDDDDGSS